MRLSDPADYFDSNPRAHTAQGDVYAEVPLAFVHDGTVDADRPRGGRKRPLLEKLSRRDPPSREETKIWVGPAVVCSYTCGFVAQPPGTEGYAHNMRLMAPIVSLRQLKRYGYEPNELRKVQTFGGVFGLMYLPSVEPDETRDEWHGDSAVMVFRPSLVTQELLDNRVRLKRLSEPAQRILISQLIQVVGTYAPDTDDWNFTPPDQSDSWAAH